MIAIVSVQGGFYPLQRIAHLGAFGFQWMVCFFEGSGGTLAVRVRLAKVQQLFCISANGDQITFAGLTQAAAVFVVAMFEETLLPLNPTVGRIIR